ncbi:MAG: type II toxin-antitoxin system RelE/ParE family toxin [Hyphomicrobiales bacterium]|nr:MAG: type II toxin-antitoxin system RelE/ParE family toxin [Hyphomicrobiales bacterium]
MPLSVHHTNAARRDLRSIWSFIASDNPPAADGQLRRIGESIRHLASTPQMGRARDDLAPKLRSFPVGRYLVFFDFDATTLRTPHLIGDVRVALFLPEQISPHRLAIRLGPERRAVGDHLAHGAAQHVELGGKSIAQRAGDRGDIIAFCLQSLGRQCRRLAAGAPGRVAGEFLALVHRAEQVAWRVTHHAMPRPLDQVAAAVPAFRMAGVGLIAAWREEQVLPARHQRSQAKRKGHLVRLCRGGNRRHLLQRRIEIGNILIAHQRVVLIGERRVEVPRRPLAIADRPRELCQRPAADARLGVRGDVGRIERAEWRHQPGAATEFGHPVLLVGVAGDAIAQPQQVLPTRHVAGERQVTRRALHRLQHIDGDPGAQQHGYQKHPKPVTHIGPSSGPRTRWPVEIGPSKSGGN